VTTFLSRLAERSAATGPRLAPKGLLSRAPAHDKEEEEERGGHGQDGGLDRLAEPDRKDKEQAARADKKDDEKKPEPAPLSRSAPTEEKEPPRDKEEPQSAHRAAKMPDEPEKKKAPEAQGKRPAEEEAHALRRSADGGGEEEEKGGEAHRALRRSEDDKEGHKEGEEKEEARALRRDPASPEEHERLPKPEQTRDEKEPNQLTALRRSPSPGLAAPSPAGAPLFEAGIGGFGPLRPPSPAAEAGFQRPTVQIDQLDVIVQEPASAAPAGAMERSRSIRARYLRKL
jgi:hypothetical protein